MGRLDKIKRELIEESNKRLLNEQEDGDNLEHVGDIEHPTTEPELSVRRKRFLKVATERVNKIIYGIEKLSNFTQKTNYDAKPEELKSIIKVLKKEVDELEKKFKNPNTPTRTPWTL